MKIHLDAAPRSPRTAADLEPGTIFREQEDTVLLVVEDCESCEIRCVFLPDTPHDKSTANFRVSSFPADHFYVSEILGTLEVTE